MLSAVQPSVTVQWSRKDVVMATKDSIRWVRFTHRGLFAAWLLLA